MIASSYDARVDRHAPSSGAFYHSRNPHVSRLPAGFCPERRHDPAVGPAERIRDESGHSPPVPFDDCFAVRLERYRADLRRNFRRQRLADPLTAATGAGHLGGVAFLLWYGWGAFRSAFSPQPAQAAAQELAQSRWRIVVTMLAVTWLNPHVYLDTFVVLGSLGGQLTADVRSGSRSGRSARRRCGSSGWRCWPLAGAVAEHAAGAAHHQRAGRAGDVGHRAAAGLAGGKFIRICH